MISRIHIIRAEKRITQKQLAKSVGVNQSVLSGWENGLIATAKFSNVLKLAETLGCSVYDLFEDDAT
jgi:transcriptional regulator with XRE-family HTH domain